MSFQFTYVINNDVLNIKILKKVVIVFSYTPVCPYIQFISKFKMPKSNRDMHAHVASVSRKQRHSIIRKKNRRRVLFVFPQILVFSR